MDTVVTIVLCIVAVLLINTCIFLLMMMPSHKRLAGMKKFDGIMLAHRGLHGGSIAENSMPAFAAAADRGIGIELDVRLSSDGEVVIFHDDTLERMTGMSGGVSNYTAKELKEMSLAGTGYGIPTLREVLALVDGRVPLLVELKENVGNTSVTEKTAEILREYKGDFMVESFNPLAVDHFHRLMPEIPAGILCKNYMKHRELRTFRHFAAQNMLTNCFVRPDFIAYAYEDRRNAALRILRLISPSTPILAWTIRSPEQEITARKCGFTGFIFEGYTPAHNDERKR